MISVGWAAFSGITVLLYLRLKIIYPKNAVPTFQLRMEELSKATSDFVQVSQQLRKMMKARMDGTKEHIGTEGAFIITELKNLNATAQLAKEKVINQVKKF